MDKYLTFTNQTNAYNVAFIRKNKQNYMYQLLYIIFLSILAFFIPSTRLLVPLIMTQHSRYFVEKRLILDEIIKISPKIIKNKHIFAYF